MAESEAKEPETAASTPESHNGSASNKASKDRQCPFCGQAFTSSSLGRHLDLYIKPRNPKPADGVHDVEEIKKLRGSITRRQPKASLKPGANVNASGWRHESTESTPATSASKPHTRRESRANDGSPLNSPVNYREGDFVQTSINTAAWQATGVINNLPPRGASRNNNSTPSGQAQRMHDMRQDGSGQKIQRPEHDDGYVSKLQEDAEVGRAAELALREILSSLEAAKRKVSPSQVFENVDFFSLSFPGLCLAILPPPTSLFSHMPFSSGDSWGLNSPGHKEYTILNRLISTTYRLRSVEDPDQFTDSMGFRYAAHASAAYEHWQLMSEEDKAHAWTLETLRAFATSQKRANQHKEQLEAAQNRIRHLEAEFDRLSKCQLPREYVDKRKLHVALVS
jgi:hypothetical protein